MKRKQAGTLVSLLVAAALTMPITAASAATPTQLEAGDPSIATETERKKIDIMGIWAHPDDDAGFTTPCGVWHDLYGINCGIIMATRGEGGSNSVGSEAGPDLGLRRENEDRTSHVRSGTVDIFNLDRVDFYYNTSAPLTAEVWDAEETLRRTVRIIRETQPEILVGSSPSLAVGHGNHQYAQGRMIWEASAAAADPTRFPEQLVGAGAVEPWQVKKILAGGLTTGTGGTLAANCNTGFTPAATNPFTVVGTWTGYDSPYTWADGNVAGQAAGSAKTWAQVGREGGRAHPTQARVMQKTLWDPTCQRYGVSQSLVPMQPSSSDAGQKDDALFYGATVADPGGMPLGSLFYPEAEEYFEAAGEPFTVTVNLRSGSGTLAGGDVSLQVPAGWTTSGPVSVNSVSAAATGQATFTVVPAATAAPARYRIAATFSGSGVTAYNDTRVELVSPVEGRFERWGTAAEYEQWTEQNDAYVGGRSNAVGTIGAGETVTVPVQVTNRTAVTESGTVALQLPNGITADAATKPYSGLAAGASTTVDFVLTHADPTDRGSRTETLTATTTSGAGQATESMTMYVVPSVVIPQLASAPNLDGAGDDYTGGAIDLGARWEGEECAPAGVDCGAGSTAQLGWFDDALYAHIRVTDDIAGSAATPDRCFGHWLTDSVEVLLDPRGNSIDTSSTFKLGVFPYTDDATGSNGNGVNGPCWSRDADNHQGFSTGPLANTVEDAPNAPGVEVSVKADRDSAGKYVGGAYEMEIKIPLNTLPAAVGPTGAAPQGDAAVNEVDPNYLGLNLTPYDSDTQDFIGQTRTAWSAFGSQQSEPYRWGHAYLDGYTAPAGRTTVAPAAIIPDTALQGVESPQTVFQSATRGGTISGVAPSEAMTVGDVTIGADVVRLNYSTTAAGTARVFLWKGDATFTPVWTSSCAGDIYGFEACAASDGAAAPWAPNMGGKLLAEVSADVAAGAGTVEVPIDAAMLEALAEDSQILVSFAQSGSAGPANGMVGLAAVGDGVNAWAFPIQVAAAPGEPTDPGTPSDPGTPGTPGTPGMPGTPGDPGGAGDGGAGGANAGADRDGSLSNTGATVMPFIAGGVLLLLAGAVAMFIARRRRGSVQ